MLLFSDKRSIIVIENSDDEISSLPIIIEDGESEMESDFEDPRPIFITIQPWETPDGEWNESEIEIDIEPANVEYVEVELVSDSYNSFTNDSDEMDINDDTFCDVSDWKHPTEVPVFQTDDSDSVPKNEEDIYTNVNTNESESSNSQYHTACDNTV